MKLTDKLPPCPFCGCTKVPKRQGNGIGDYWLECFDCGASTRLREDGAGNEKDWNRRPDATSAAAAPVVHRAAEQLVEPQPYLYVYEFDSPFGVHRDVRYGPYNGRYPDRTVALYAAPLPRASDAAAQKCDLRFRNGQWWECTDPDIDRWIATGKGDPQEVAKTTQDVAQGDERTALQWTSGTLQAIVAGRWRDVKEMDKVSAGAVVKTIAEVLDMADVALARATTPQPDPLTASSETLRAAIENHSRFAAGLAFGLAHLARKRGMGGAGSMQEAMAADAARSASSTAEIERKGEGE